MPYNGSGVFSIVNTFTPGTTISSSAMNANFTDVATGLSDCLTRDGQAPMTAALKLINGNTSVPSLTFASEPTLGLYRNAAGVLGVAGSLEVDTNLAVTGALTVMGNPVLPIGLGPLPWSGLTAPSLWVFARGQALSRTTYASLWAFASAEISGGNTLYTNGDGSSTFTVPDLRGRIPAGNDVSVGRLTSTTMTPDGNTLGATGGEQTHTLTTPEISAHTHTGSTGNESNSHTHTSQGASTTNATATGATAPGGTFFANATTQTSGVASVPHNHPFTTDSSGGGSAHNNVQPSIITNYIIYAGA